ncbi:MAG: carbohydrate kinase family protein [Alphaproteobacteria bacterium]
MTHDVAVVGLTILDILGRPVERIPEGGNVEFIEEIRLTVAGTAGGTVVDCAKLGLRSMAVGCLGADEKGDFILDSYRRLGIDASAMQRTEAAPTSATILNVRPNGDRPALHVRGASDHLKVEPHDYDRICAGRFLHMGGTGLLQMMDGQPTASLLEAAKARGVIVTFDLIAPNAGTLELLKPCLPHVDYFMPSMEEAAFISGLDSPERIAAFFLDLGAKACIFKWGARGSYFATPAGQKRLPAYRVDVSDTTGCGDAYCAGFIAGLAQDWEAERACLLATAASGLVATGLGSDAGIVDLASTIAFMEGAEVLD